MDINIRFTYNSFDGDGLLDTLRRLGDGEGDLLLLWYGKGDSDLQYIKAWCIIFFNFQSAETN